MRDFGINVPKGFPAQTPEEAVEAAKKIGMKIMKYTYNQI